MNGEKYTEFTFLGFQNPQIFNPLIFSIFLFIYMWTLLGNLLIIILSATMQSLKSPMYFFLSHLSLSDILLTTNIIPNMLHVILNGGSTISVGGCITQLYFYGVSTAAECLLLTVMSYDRYLAVCRPLHYTSIMDLTLQRNLAVAVWVFAFAIMSFFILLIRSLEFCGRSMIDHYFCDLAPLLELSCSDITVIKHVNFVSTLLFMLVPFLFILFTYVRIFIAIFGISTKRRNKKSFSTCSSHLTVVSAYYGTLITVYMAPTTDGQLFNVKKVLALLYTIVTPFFNPIIYSLKNEDIKSALMKLIRNNTQMV